MERNKETVRKPYSDFYASKRLGIVKTDSRYSNKSDSVRNKASYISQSKNIPINKNFYDNEARSFYENCNKCFQARPHILVNSPCNVPQIDSGHDLNGNVTYNAYPICNLTSLVNYQSNQHYEISISKCKNIKPRTVYPNQKSYSHKISTPVYSANKFYSSMHNSSVRSSKNVSSKYACSDSYLKITDKPTQETLSNEEKYSKYNVKCAFSEQCLPADEVKLSDLPLFMHSKLPKDPCASSVSGYSENQLQKRKHYKKWDPVSISRDVESSMKLNEAENMMLFPALPTSNHCQKIKINSSCTNSMPPSEISIENTKLDSSTSGSINLTSSVAVPSTIPQASYADVIRMSSICSGGVQSYVALEIEKSLNPEENEIQEKLKEENPQQSSDWVILRLSQIDLNSPDSLNNHAITNSNPNGQNFASPPRPIVVSLEKPSFYNSSMPACKSVLSALSCSPGKKEEIESLTADCLNTSDKSFTDGSSVSGSTNRSSVSSDLTSSTETQLASSKTDSVYSSPSSDGSFDAFKEVQNKDLSMEGLVKKEPPVIILNSSAHDNISQISFGIEHEEMLKLCSDASVNEKDVSLLVKDSIEDPFSDNISTVDPHVNLSLQSSDNVSTYNAEEIEMPLGESIAVNGKRLHWKDEEVQFDRSNHAQLAEYFTGIWNDLGHDDSTDPGLTNGLQYYHEL